MNAFSIITKLIYFFTLTFFLSTNSLIAQKEFLVKDGRNYFFEEKEYTLKELKQLYKPFPYILKLYHKGRSKRTTGRIIAIAGVPFLLGTAIYVNRGGGTRNLVFGSYTFAVGGLIEGIGLFLFIRGSQHLIKARSLFNYEMIEQNGYEGASLNLGVSENRLALVYNF